MRRACPLTHRTPKPLLEERWHGGAVTERCAAAQRRRRVSALCTRRNPAGSLRCGNTSQSWLRHASSPRGEPALSGDALLSLPLRGGGTPEGRDGEVCRRTAAAARQRPSAHAETLRQTFGAVTPLSHGLRHASSPRGEPFPQASSPVRPAGMLAVDLIIPRQLASGKNIFCFSSLQPSAGVL